MQATTTITTHEPTRHTPRNYQLDGIKYATTPRVRRNQSDLLPTLCRSMNTDAPGAGKSEQALWAADQLVPKHHSICIIVPAFLVDQWFKLIAEQFPDDTLVSLEGQEPKRSKYFSLHARWYVISVQSLRRKPIYEKLYNLYIREHVDFTIIDESHYVKNPTAKQSVNVRSLTNPNFCPHVMLLTATPITKEADDLYHQLRIIDPITFHAQHEFLNKYCYFTWTSWGATNVTLRKTAHEQLEAQRENPNDRKSPLVMSSGYMLGRTYAQIGLELPDLIPLDSDAIVSVDMEPNRRKAYDDLKQSWYTALADGETLSVDSAMQLMHLLRRITNSPEKMRQLTNYMENDPGPYVIACFYRASAQQLADFIQKLLPDKNPICITGEVPADERVRIAKQYNKPNDVIIATIPSLCEGVDLSHANTVYFYEEDYTPGRMYQFLSRVRRHRATNNVGVTITADNHLLIDDDPNTHPIIRRYFHATKSIDERIHAVQSLRSVNIRALVKVEVMS